MSKTRRATLGSTGIFADVPPASKAAPAERSAGGRPDREGRGAVPFWTTTAAKKQLRMLAATLDTTQQELLTDALNDLFTKHGKPPIA